MYICVYARVEGGSGSRSSQMFDISCVLAFAILFMYAEPRYIFTRCILLRIYIYAGWGEENGGVDERRERGTKEFYIYIYINSFGFQNDLESILFEISKIGKKMGRGVEGELLSTSASEEHR